MADWELPFCISSRPVDTACWYIDEISIISVHIFYRPASSKPATGSNTGPSAGSGPGSSSFPRRNTGGVGTPGTAPAAGTAGDKASTEEEDQANSLNELATVLTNTHNMLTAAVQRHRTEAATSPKRNQNQQRKRDAKPRLSYEEILKHLQFGMFVKDNYWAT